MQLVILAGLMLVSWFLRPKPQEQHTEGPRVDDLKVSSSTFGTPIPILYGTCRLGGILIDSSDLTEHKHVEEQETGGKGGGGGGSSTYTWYSYTASFAMAFCASTSNNPVYNITKIWAGSDLIYDLTSTSIKKLSGLSIKKYYGTESQLPDPTLEALHGVGRTPAYRGIAYVVFTNMDLTDYGNAIPSITAEVCSSGTRVGSSKRVFENAPWVSSNNILIDRHHPYFYYADNGNLYKYDLLSGELLASRYIGLENIYDLDTRGYIYGAVGTGGQGGIVCIEPEFLSTVWQVSSPSAYGVNDLSFGLASLVGGGLNINTICGCSYLQATMWSMNARDGSILWTSTHAGSYLWAPLAQIFQVSADICWAVKPVSGQTFLYCYEDGVLSETYDLSSYISNGDCLTYDVTNGCFLIGSTSQYRLVKFDRESRTVTGTLDGVVSQFAQKSFRHGTYGGRLYLQNELTQVSVDIRTMTIVDTVDISIIDSNISELFNGVYHDQTMSIIGVAMPKSGSNALYILRIQEGSVSVELSHIVNDISTRRDSWMIDEQLGTSDIDVTDLMTTNVSGYIINNQMSRRQALEPLMSAYQFEACLENNKIKFSKLGHEYCCSIYERDLSAHEPSEEMPEPLLISQDHELELPCQVSLTYLNPDKEYEQSTQYSRRLVSSSQKVVAISHQMVLSDDEAAQIAEKLLFIAWTARYQHKFTLSRKFMYLSPTDVVYVIQDSKQYRLRLAKIDYGVPGLLPVEAVEDNAVDVDSRAVGAPTEVIEQTINYIGPTRLYLLDTALLRDVDDNAGFYISATGYVRSWPGCLLYRSIDNGESYTDFQAITEPAIAGIATSALPLGPSAVFDEGNYVDVIVYNSEVLYSATELNVLNGSNVALLGDHGRWEIIQWKTATLIDVDANQYRLSGLLRGRKGTEWAINTHQVRDKFIVLQSNYSITRKNFGASDIGLSRLYKAVTTGMLTASATPVSFANTAVGLKPYAPVHIKGKADSSNNITITWIRRGRIDAEWRDYIDVPLGEASELYKVEIVNGAVVVRTITNLTSATCTYTAAQQIADFGVIQHSITVRVYQISDSVGDGYPGVETLNVS